MVAKRTHGLSKKLRLAFLPLLANRSVNTESIRSVANSVGQGVSSLSTSQIRLDLEKGEKILFDDDVAREINLPLQDGSHFTWPIASPQGLLRKYSAASPALRRMLSKSPNTADRPWGLVHYHDEISPGDILRPILSRQHTVFRFTFKEFGKTMLSNTRLWFTYAVLRTTVSKRVVGGLSRCFKELMRVFFKTHENFHEVGVAIDTDAGKTLFFAVNRNVVADEKALKMTFSFKGASGSKPCGACANVYMKGFSKNKKTKKKILKAKGTRAIDITCFDRKGIVPNTNEAIWQYHDLLDTFKDKVSKAVFEKMEVALGTVYNPESVVADKDLRALFRPLDVLTFDWVHNYLCGIGPTELYCLLRRCKTVNVTYQELEQDTRTWTFPHRLDSRMPSPHQVFAGKRANRSENGKEKTWKLSASEFLSVLRTN